MKNNPISLELYNISKSFGDRDVLSDISFSLDSGCLVVTGPNGSGKSTLLRIAAGLLNPSSGKVVFTVDGRPVDPGLRRNLVGLVAPDLALYDDLSALENLRFFARVRGLHKSDADLRSALDKVGLAGREDDRLGAYSSGMKQRARFAFALLHEPPILLLDEPSSSLDEAGISIVDCLVSKWRERGIVMLATNEQSELRYADIRLDLGSGGC